MARCQSCSAPLLANTNICQYCNVRNDVDLHAKHDFIVQQKVSGRICPHCAKPMPTIQLQLDDVLHIERCNDCYGLFFDKGEIDALLSHSVSHVNEINLQHLENINTERFPSKSLVKYIKCPVCQSFMHRTNFAQKSGVVVDICRHHGVWLDSGEVTHLMEWKKAGGQLLHEKREQQKVQPRKTKSQQSAAKIWQNTTYESQSLDTGVLDVLSFVIGKIF